MKRTSFGAIITASAFSLLSSLGQNRPPSKCLTYEPDVVKISGTLVRKTFAGPPNYESTKKGDKPEVSWLLELPTSVCMDVDKVDPDLNPSRTGVRQMQLVLQPEQYSLYKALIGRNVVATGTLFGEHTGHHHTPVLLTVRTLEQAQR